MNTKPNVNLNLKNNESKNLKPWSEGLTSLHKIKEETHRLLQRDVLKEYETSITRYLTSPKKPKSQALSYATWAY